VIQNHENLNMLSALAYYHSLLEYLGLISVRFFREYFSVWDLIRLIKSTRVLIGVYLIYGRNRQIAVRIIFLVLIMIIIILIIISSIFNIRSVLKFILNTKINHSANHETDFASKSCTIEFLSIRLDTTYKY